MSSRARAILASLAALAVAGCAAQTTQSRARSVAPVPTTAPATRPVRTAAASYTLDELPPRPVMPASRPATVPTTGPAPLDAIALFAEARAKILANQRIAAVNLLEDAIRLDPGSFALHFALGEAFAGVGTYNLKAIEHYLIAASINPNHLGVQTELGRQYLAKGELDTAIKHLRLALLTSDYRKDGAGAGAAEFLLARALQRNGNDRAALDAYARLLVRLRRPGAVRGNGELAILASQPEALFVQVGELYQKNGAYDDALRAFELAASRRPESFDYAARIVRALLAAGRRDAAAARAADLVRTFRASPDSLELLRESYRDAGGDAAVAQRLTALHRQSPDDRAILYALVNVLTATGQRGEAERVLRGAVERGRYAIEDVRRLFASYAHRDDVDAAAALLTDAMAARSESWRELTPLWTELLRPWRRNRLRVSRLQKLEVSAASEGAKQFWVSLLARVMSRDVLARTALEQSVKSRPPLPPAYRELLDAYWTRSDWDEQRMIEASQALIESVGATENAAAAALAAELRGRLLLKQNKAEQAAEELARAERLGDRSPDLRIAQALVARATGNVARFEQMLWTLVSDHPTCEDAYELLLNQYLDPRTGAGAPTLKLLRTWLAADPENIKARLIEASLFAQARQTAAAEQSLVKLFDRYSESEDLLTGMRQLYGAMGRLDRFIDMLEAERIKHPENRAAVQALVELYAQQKRTGEAGRVLEAARAAVAKDPELLYYVAHLYTRIGQEDVTEEILAQVVRLDPNHPAASNDLGYGWADKGKNLDRAEQLIRVAVAAEPDNQSFLDSLGWVLYKRSKFDEAREQLEAAIAPATLPDPVVLDHLGDTLYRLGRAEDATRQWKRSAERIAGSDSSRPDIRQLRLELQKKLKQVEDGQPVTVAPVVEGAAAPQQAKQ